MAVLLGAAVLAGCSGGEERQAEADARAKGFVPPSVTSRLDFGGQQERRFRRMDHNGDDVIDRTEIPSNPRNPNDPRARIATLDRNGDGRITLQEFTEGSMSRFDAADLNHDGTVTSEERQTAETKR